MPIIFSAKKRLRQSIKRTARNQAIQSKLKTLTKKALSEPTKENIRLSVQTIDKAAKRKVIHANKASRLKSRVMRALPTPSQTKKS